ncbi:hypothetical protein AB0G97_28285 [Streptomyces sp. NPDC020755]|uniref:hypothetical protein n=1 Tax=Streptomyces sp. NPDC020755 TaxID=3154790 RepID=UPI0033D13C9E
MNRLRDIGPSLVRTSLVCACVVVLSGCGSSGDGGEAAASDEAALALSRQPTVKEVPKIDIKDMPPFPIEEYLPKVGEDAKINAASAGFIRSCMARFGFDYHGPDIGQSTLDSQENGANRQRRYGISSEELAVSYGYHLPRTGPPADRGASAPVMSKSENKVFIGDQDPASGVKPGDKIAGKEIPSGGCSGEAQRKLEIKPRQRMAEKINNVSFARSQENPQVLKAFKSWSDCMAHSGYSYKTPLEPLDNLQGSSASPSEISAAKMDVACKGKVNLAGTWFAVESEIQSELISRNEEILKEDAKSFDALVRRASDEMTAR